MRSHRYNSQGDSARLRRTKILALRMSCVLVVLVVYFGYCVHWVVQEKPQHQERREHGYRQSPTLVKPKAKTPVHFPPERTVWNDLGLKTPPVSAQELEMVPCDLLLCPKEGLLPQGVLFTAYSTDRQKLVKKFLPEVMTSARSFKKHNRALPACLVTNLPSALIDGSVFDFVIVVREDLMFAGAQREPGYSPQWFTRLLYLASSPFSITLSADGNTGFCMDIEAQFKALEEYDFVVASATREPCTVDYPHNFILGFTKGESTKELFRRWILEQLKDGVPVDDQAPLHRALMSMAHTHSHAFRAGYFETSFATSFVHHDNLEFKSWLPALTRSLSTPIPIVHPVDPATFPGLNRERALQKICQAFNHSPERVRILLLHGKYGNASIAEFRSPDACDEFLGTSCAGPVDGDGQPACFGTQDNLSWDPPRRGAYIRPYPS